MKILTVVDFLYRGEANIIQENLDSFFAQELQGGGTSRWGKNLESAVVSIQSRQSNFKAPTPDPPKEIKIVCIGKQLQEVENISKEKEAIPEYLLNR